nr:LysM peptidoglycan-binding domain-containing protein [Advenella kashmirensis]
MQRGDTLYKISRANNVSVSQLMSMNKLSSPALEVGQRLRVSTSASSSSAGTDSVVAGSATPTAAGSASATPASDATAVSWGWPVATSKIITQFSASTRVLISKASWGIRFPPQHPAQSLT